MLKHTGYKLISITILYKISSSRISLIFIFHKILSVSKIKKGRGRIESKAKQGRSKKSEGIDDSNPASFARRERERERIETA